jgi:hypothetical protein
MPSGAPGRHRLIPLLLFGCAGTLCSVVSYGDLSTIDARIMLDAARHVAAGEGFIVDPAIGIPGAGGYSYAYYGPANSLVMLPIVIAARTVTSLASMPLPVTFLEEFLSAMAGAWIKAIGVVVVYAMLQAFEDEPRRNVLAAMGGLVMGFDFQYGRSYFAEVPAAACLLLAGYGLVMNRTAPGRHHMLLMGSALALATAFRWEMAVFVPVFAVVAWRQRRPDLATTVAFVVPLCLVAVALAFYNTTRFSAFWKTGYERLPPSASPMEGWVGLMLAPGAGLLWFAPWCLSLAAWPRLKESDDRLRELRTLVLLLLVVACLLYGSWSSWTGGLAWGPRFLVPLVPLLSILAILVWRRSMVARSIGLPLAAASVMLNVLLVIAPHERLHAYATVNGWTTTERVWSPRGTPWLHQPRMAVEVARNLPRVRDFAARARERINPRSQPTLPGQIDMADALHNSVSLNVPAVWWIRLLVVGAPLWLAAGLGLLGISASTLLFNAALRRAGRLPGERL